MVAIAWRLVGLLCFGVRFVGDCGCLLYVSGVLATPFALWFEFGCRFCWIDGCGGLRTIVLVGEFVSYFSLLLVLL